VLASLFYTPQFKLCEEIGNVGAVFLIKICNKNSSFACTFVYNSYTNFNLTFCLFLTSLWITPSMASCYVLIYTPGDKPHGRQNLKKTTFKGITPFLAICINTYTSNGWCALYSGWPQPTSGGGHTNFCISTLLPFQCVVKLIPLNLILSWEFFV
jgi:hypothetical protein